jgi:hypothetical protein
MAKVEGRLTGGTGASTVTLKVAGKFDHPSHWDEFYAQLVALGKRYNIRVEVLKRTAKPTATAKAKKKAAPSKKK